ncbi:MAG: hypothetical protein WCG77_05045 [Actinomycetes bacterium]|jgi:hypothetical protein
MRFEDVVDVDTIMRVQREHDRDVISEAYEVFVAELATTRIDDAVRALSVGTEIELHLSGGSVVRGRTGPAVVGWVCVEVDRGVLLVPMTSVCVLQPHRATRHCTDAPTRSVCSVLREHHACGGSVRLWWPDGTRKVARLSSVCADYVVLECGSWVPLAGLQACELL